MKTLDTVYTHTLICRMIAGARRWTARQFAAVLEWQMWSGC